MGFFSKKKQEPSFTEPKDMSPVEVVTHLFAIIQLSDNESSYEEREAWSQALADMFPMHSSERADQFLNDAFSKLSPLNQIDRQQFFIQILEQIKKSLSVEQIQGELKEHLKNLILADGMIMSGEVDAVQIIESNLDIKLDGLDEEDLF